MDDDLIKALSSELPTPSVRPDSVHLISGAIVATRRRRARAAIIGSVAAVAILVTVIAGTVTNLATPDSGPAQPTPVASSTSSAASRTGSGVSSTSGPSAVVGSTTRPLAPPVATRPSRTSAVSTSSAALITSPGTTAPVHSPIGVGTGAAADPATTGGTSTTSKDTTSSGMPGSLSTQYATFTMPSGNVTCVDNGQLSGIACWLTNIAFSPAAVANCSYSLAGHYVLLTGTTDAISCPVGAAPGAGPVLPYGTTNVSAHATCVSRESALTCTRNDGSGVGFVLKRSAVQFVTGNGGQSPNSPDTVVHTYQPWSGAAVAAGITVVSQTDGTCTATAITTGRSDARRCAAGSAIHDPCFVSPAGGKQALCADGATDRVIELDLPGATSLKAYDAKAWAVQTPDGQFCMAFSGAGSYLNGNTVYGCPDGREVIADPLQTSGAWIGTYAPIAASPTTANGPTIGLTQVWK